LNLFVEEASPKTRIRPADECSGGSRCMAVQRTAWGKPLGRSPSARVANPVGPALNLFVEKASPKTRISPVGKCSTMYMGHPYQDGNT